jgi:hypothetical protein
LHSEINMEVGSVFFVIGIRQSNTYSSISDPLYFYFIWSVVQGTSDLYPLQSVVNIFKNWLHDIDHKFRTLIRVGALTVI